MNKISKDQADWLIKEVTSHFQDDAGLCVAISDVKKLINQCTEKEFPTVELYNADKVQLLRIYRHKEDIIRISKSLSSEVVWLDLNFDEFEQFTQGCVKICDWLQEQE